MNVSFDHVIALSNEFGTFEHADHDQPRIEHGFCVDDVARVLIATCRADHREDQRLDLLEERSLDFVVASLDVDGSVRNRRNHLGEWTSDAGVGDWWGRAVWALGVCARYGSSAERRTVALDGFDLAARRTSRSPRALAFAVLGATDILDTDPDHRLARARIADYIAWYESRPVSEAWPWPEARLAYANAVVCDALIAAGYRLDRRDLVDSGLSLLAWLLERQTVDGHLSVVPVTGSGPTDATLRFDQQPIEVARLADACERAYEATIDERWIEGVRSCVAWFDGDNDLGVPMWDPATGAGFDGLTARGPNLNRGAESTLAAVTTAQVAHRLDSALDAHVRGL